MILSPAPNHFPMLSTHTRTTRPLLNVRSSKHGKSSKLTQTPNNIQWKSPSTSLNPDASDSHADGEKIYTMDESSIGVVVKKNEACASFAGIKVSTQSLSADSR